MVKKPTKRLLLVACLAATAARADGQDSRPASRPAGRGALLGARYVDALNGFSVRAPAGATLNREFSPDRLVYWTVANRRTGAVIWTLGLRRLRGNPGRLDPKAYARALVRRMRAEEDFQVISVTHDPVGGRKAMHFRGKTGGMLALWRHEIWLTTAPGRFFVVSIVGPSKLQAHLDALCLAVAGTLQLTDPWAARAEARDNLRRGEKLLEALTDEKLAGALLGEDRWYLLHRKGKCVGFRKVSERRASEGRTRGFQVTTWGLLRLEDQDVRLIKRVMFTTADRRLERWKDQLQIGLGPAARTVAEDGIKQAELIVCSIDQGSRIQARQKTVPSRKRLVEAMKRNGRSDEEIRALTVPAYLPRAMGHMLWRLVDPGAAGAYAFATFNSATGDLDMRTFTVVGPERITLGGRTIRAIRVADRASPDREPMTGWLDEKGRLLRVQIAGGVTMEHSTLAAVLGRFPKALETIQGMAAWGSQK